MYRLAIYGKGGIGKSTTACNLAAALAQAGATVLQVGCDPKADSTALHLGGARIPTVLDLMRAGGAFGLDDVVLRAPDGVLCVEAGGPVPGVGCAGRGIAAAFDVLARLRAFEVFQPDYVLYDVLGDVVCGGFAMPLRGQYSDAVMVVSSGEKMSLYAAGNIMSAVAGFQARGYARFAGLIANLRDVEDELAKIERFCEEREGRVAAVIPRSREVQRADDEGTTVVGAHPDSAAAAAYRSLADVVRADAEALAEQRAKAEMGERMSAPAPREAPTPAGAGGGALSRPLLKPRTTPRAGARAKARSMANLARHIPEQRQKSTLRVPESHELYVCPNSCGRRQGIRAVRNGVAEHASFLTLSQADVALGDYEGQIVDAVAQVLARIAPRPRMLTLHVNCIDDFLGTDTAALMDDLSARHPDVRFLLSRINPIAGDAPAGDASPARKAQSSLYAPLEPRGVRDDGVNVVGSFVALPAEGELGAAVRAAGAGPLRQLPACGTFEEYARMADSRLTVSVSHLEDGVAADLEERLGIPWTSWHACYDVEETARRHARLAEALGGSALDASVAAAAARAAIERARAVVGDLPVVVDTAASFAPFSLAVALLDVGFDVRAVFALHTKGADAGLGELRDRYPRVRVLREEDCRAESALGLPRACLAIGQDAAYLLRARCVLDMYHDEGYFGFDGIVRLMDGMAAACARCEEEA